MPSHHRTLGRKSKERDARTLRPLLYKATVPVGASVGDHGLLTGLLDNDHTQYAEIAQTEAITGAWTHSAHLKVDTGYNIQLGAAGPLYMGYYSDTDIGLHGGFRSISPDFASETTGWHISYDGEADFRRIFADELHVRAFIADIEQALAGGQIISKSVAILQQDFTVPTDIDDTGTIYVEDLPGFDGTQAFETGDYVRMRYIDRSGGGLVVADVWGTVTSYSDEGGGYQSWTFTLKQGDGDVVIYGGAIVLDYGTTGQGYHEITTIDTKFSPYAQIVTWATNPWTPANLTIQTRIGQLDGVTDTDLSPEGWGLYSTNAFLKGSLVAADGEVTINDNGITIQAAASETNYLKWDFGVTGEYVYYKGYKTNEVVAGYVIAANSTVGGGAFIQISADGDEATTIGVRYDNATATERYIQYIVSDDTVAYMYPTKIEIHQDIMPATHNVQSIGADALRIKDLYVVNLYATNSSTGEELSGQNWSYAGDMNIYPDLDSDDTLVSIINRDETYAADLYVERNITLGGTVDGVDIASFKSGYDTHVGNANAHHNRSHVITSASDHTVTGAQYSVVGMSAVDTLGVLVSSDNPGANIRILRSTSAGGLTLETLTVNTSVGFDSLVVTKSGTFNESGGDYDFRVEGDTVVNLLFVDASTDRVGINTNAPAKMLEIIDAAAAQLRLTHTAGSYYADLQIDGSGNLIIESIGNVVINEAGDETDFRVEGGTLANLLLVDGSADMVGINTAAPARRLDILDAANPQVRLTHTAGTYYADLQVDGSGNLVLTPVANVVINEGGGSAIDFRVEGDTNTHLLFVDSGLDRVGVNTSAPAAKLHVVYGGAQQLRLGYNVDNYADFSISSGGNLTLKPTGDLVLDPTGNDVLPEQAYDINLGALNKKYLTLHAAELWVETLVAQDTIATIGGRILVGPTTVLVEDLPADQTWMKVKHNQMAMGDTCYMEANSKVEFNLISGRAVTDVDQADDYFKIFGNLASLFEAHDTLAVVKGSNAGTYTVVSATDSGSDTLIYVEEEILSAVADDYLLYSGVAGSYIYLSVTRDRDGSGSNDWYAGDAVFNTGATSDGFIDLYSIGSVKGGTQYGPTIVGNVRNSTTYNDWTEHWAIGNLNGLYGYGTNIYGVGLGKYSGGNYMTVDSTNGVRFFDTDDVVRASLSASTWTIGRTGYYQTVITDSALSMYKNADDRTFIVNTNGVFMGDYTDAEATRSYIYIDTSGNMKFIKGASTNINIQLYATGSAAFGRVASTHANAFWNESNDRLEFRGGTGGTVVQSYIDTDGSFVSGAGVVKMNLDGLAIATSTAYSNLRSYGFYTSGSLCSQIAAFEDATDRSMRLYVERPTGKVAKISLDAASPASYASTMSLAVQSDGYPSDKTAGIYLYAKDNDVAYIRMGVAAAAVDTGTVTIVEGGVEIDQAGNDGYILELQSSDVAHGITSYAETDTYGAFRKHDANSGGLRIDGFTEDEVAVSFLGGATAADTTHGTGGVAPVVVNSALKSLTSLTSVSANGNLFAVRNASSTKFIVDAEGDVFIDGSQSSYDDYDDLALIRGFEQNMAQRGERIDMAFKGWLDARRNDLVDVGIMQPEPDNYFYNVTRLQRLQNGALWQLHERLDRIEKLLLANN